MRFHRWHPSLLVGGFFTVGASIQIVTIWTATSVGLKMFAGVLLLVTLLLGVRGFRSSTLLIADRQVVVRTLLRRRHWLLDEVRGAMLRTGTVGVFTRSFPVIMFDSGRDYECRELITSVARSGDLTPIVEAINLAASSANSRPEDSAT